MYRKMKQVCLMALNKKCYIEPITEIVRLNTGYLMDLADASNKGGYGGAPKRRDPVF